MCVCVCIYIYICVCVCVCVNYDVRVIIRPLDTISVTLSDLYKYVHMFVNIKGA